MPAGERWQPGHIATDAPLPQAADLPPSSTQPLSPLLAYYRLLHSTAPPLRFLAASLLPPPVDQLLHHHNNMTPTLAAFHRSPLHLHVLHQSIDDEAQRCTRFVRLLTDDGRCVEFGCIAIELDVLPADVQLGVVSGLRPFGTVLLEAGVRQLCDPSGFFQVEEDDVIRQAIGPDSETEPSASEDRTGEKGERWLYGRCNVISDESGRVIARVVEILPRFDPSHQITSAPVAVETS